MNRVVQKVGLGIAVSFGIVAIAACQRTTDPVDQSSTTTDSTTESPTSQPQTTEQPSSAESAESEASTSEATKAPTPKPIPELPAECSEPQTQTEMNRCAQAEYDQADTKLNNAYQGLKASLGAQKADQLVTAEQAWLDFRDSYCDFVQSQFTGGSIQPTIYYSCLTQLTEDRTAELEQQESASASYETVDQELNAVYQNLQDYLSPTEQEQLTDAQLAWIEYRDAHCAFETGDNSACLAQVTETRVEQLEQQLESRSL